MKNWMTFLLLLGVLMGLISCQTVPHITSGVTDSVGETKSKAPETEPDTSDVEVVPSESVMENPPEVPLKNLYDRTAEGDVLYEVDFRGDSIYNPKLTYSYHLSWGEDVLKSVSEDGKTLSMKGYSFVSAPVDGCPLDNQHSYTITYTAEFSNQYYVFQGLYIDTNEEYVYNSTSGTIGYNGFRTVYNSYAFAQNGTNYTLDGKNYFMYTADPTAGISPYAVAGTPQLYQGKEYACVRHQFKLVVNGPANTLEYYVLSNNEDATADPVWARLYSIKLDEVGSSFKSDTLHLAFQSFYAYNSLWINYSDVTIYKGIVDGGAKNRVESEDTEVETIQGEVIHITSKTPGVRVLGVRNLESDDSIHLDWTCSGIEFTADLKSGDLAFSFDASSPCYYRIWVDGEEYKNGDSVYFTVSPTKKHIVIKDLGVGQHKLRMMKVTGYTLARTELTSLKLDGSIVANEVVSKDTYIEFIGDSITCAWGTIGGHSSAYTDQDGTLAYSYLLAEALDADYSMTALSGQGLLIGNPGFPKGYLYASALKNDTDVYQFERKADLTVILIGAGGVTSNFERQTLINAYKSIIASVKEKNGEDCKILCLYNPMTDYYTDSLLTACSESGGEAEGIYTYKLDRAAGNAHPSISEHYAYYETLLPIVKDLLSK